MLMHNLKPFFLFGKFTLKPSHCTSKSLLFVLICVAHLNARSQKYPASTIPDSLMENANIVVRLEEQYYEIKSTVKVISHERHVYTILNEKGDRYATYRTHYNNKSVFINSVNATLYDAGGKDLRHFKKKDMQDEPVYDGSSFVNDERLKVGGF